MPPNIAQGAARLVKDDCLDIQISLDGATADANDYVRGSGFVYHRHPRKESLPAARFKNFKLSVVCTRQTSTTGCHRRSRTSTRRSCGSHD